MQHEITTPAAIPSPQGLIKEPGWARTELLTYVRKNIKAKWYRIKEWDYYLFTNDRFGLAFTISDLGYVGLLSASFLDFETLSEHTETDLVFLSKGRAFGLGAAVREPHAECHTKRLDLIFSGGGGKRHISCHFRHFDGEKNLTAELDVTEPDMESMFILTPWKEKPTAFYYNCKRNCLMAGGTVQYGERTEQMEPQTTLGVLDWGRGVWTYDNTWYWGTGSGRLPNGALFGFNLGYGFSDRSSASENVVFYGEKVHKLGEINFGIPTNPDGSRDYLKPWPITSDDGRFEAIFTPILDRSAKMDFKLIVSDQHQVFGRMSGFCITDEGERLEFRDFLCALEEVRNKY